MVDRHNDIRPRIDQENIIIAAGLEQRMRLHLNERVFSLPVGNTTLFMDRLFMDHCADARQGRFDSPYELPMYGTRQNLPPTVWAGEKIPSQIIPVDIRDPDATITFYRELLRKVCPPGENIRTYGKSVKLDSANVMELFHRTNALAMFIAESKIQEDYSLLAIDDPEELRVRLIDLDREAKVYSKNRELVARHELGTPEFADWMTRRMIDLTLGREVAYILSTKNHPVRPTGDETKIVFTIQPRDLAGIPPPKTPFSGGWGPSRYQGSSTESWCR